MPGFKLGFVAIWLPERVADKVIRDKAQTDFTSLAILNQLSWHRRYAFSGRSNNFATEGVTSKAAPV